MRHTVFAPEKARRAALRGDRTSASGVDKSLPNRSHPLEGPRFKLRDSGNARRCAAHEGTRRSLPGFAPSAGNAWDRTSPARAICESSLLQSEQRLRADLWGLLPLFSVRPQRCATRIPPKRYRGWVEVYTRRFRCVHGHRARSASPDGSDRRQRAAHPSIARPQQQALLELTAAIGV